MIPGNQPLTPLQAEYIALQLAIASGAHEVRFQDRTIVYNSTDDMIKAANYIATLLPGPGGAPCGAAGAGAGVGGRGTRQIRFYTGKGL